MKVSCNVIKDIMPLYVEELASQDSIQMIEEHMKSCEMCKEELERMKKGQMHIVDKEKAERSLQSVKKTIKNKRSRAIAFFSLLVFVVMLTVFSYVVSPIYISYEESGMEIDTREDGKLTIHFSEGVTGFRIEKGYWDSYPDANVKEIIVWTSLWDQYLKKPSAELTVSADTDVLIFDDYAEDGEMKMVYPREGQKSTGGGVVLKRNILKAYLMLAVLLTIVLAIVCLLVRKHRKVFQVVWKICMIPVAYSLSSLLQFGNLSSYELSNTFYTIILCGCAIYAILLLAGGRDRWLS
ncbi:anti-sigma factor [Anaerosporobacter faecicola]|uniref:hypothetical protein n=1 Tax=Anaerosporobacter faecicola TaxID=2718714 RepID=UPI00143C6FBB|nr:hypothetical protein [Anaerosporobacter faecicola]